MDRTETGTASPSPTSAAPGTGSEFRFLAAGTAMERRPEAAARSALA